MNEGHGTRVIDMAHIDIQRYLSSNSKACFHLLSMHLNMGKMTMETNQRNLAMDLAGIEGHMLFISISLPGHASCSIAISSVSSQLRELRNQWEAHQVEPIQCLYQHTAIRGLATNVSFGHPEHYFLTVWTPKSLGQDLLMMTIPRR